MSSKSTQKVVFEDTTTGQNIMWMKTLMSIYAFITILFGITQATVRRYLPSTSLANRTLLIIRYFQKGCKIYEIAEHFYRLMLDYHLYVKRDDVLEMIRALDPIGVEPRKARRLLRRVYYAKGPSYIWHIDDYDKQKTRILYPWCCGWVK